MLGTGLYGGAGGDPENVFHVAEQGLLTTYTAYRTSKSSRYDLPITLDVFYASKENRTERKLAVLFLVFLPNNAEGPRYQNLPINQRRHESGVKYNKQ